MKSELRKRETIFKFLTAIYFIVFLTILSSIIEVGYFINHGLQVEDYCRKVVNRELSQNTDRPDWVDPPSWYKGSVKEKMGYGYYKGLECGRKFGLLSKIPQE